MELDDPILQKRLKLCRELGLSDVAEVHALVLKGAQKQIGGLMARGLTAKYLVELGYSEKVLRTYGYSDSTLRSLGFRIEQKPAITPPDRPVPSGPGATNEGADLARLIKSGMRKKELKAHGYGIHQVKPYCTAGEAYSLGFDLSDLRECYSPREIKMQCGLGPREMIVYFSGHELRPLFTAREFHNDGFSVEEMRRFGFNENQITGAGLSKNEKNKSGVRHRTFDDTSLHG